VTFTVICHICSKEHTPEVYVSKKMNGPEDMSLVTMDTLICPACMPKYERTWANVPEVCTLCLRRRTEEEGGLCYDDDYEKETVTPYCMECYDKMNYQ